DAPDHGTGAVPTASGGSARRRAEERRQYHERTVSSPLRGLRALSGRIVIAFVVCALLMGAAVFRVNTYINDRIDKIPRVQVTTAAATSSGTHLLMIGSDTRSFVQSEADEEAC